MVAALTWRILRDDPADGPANMAADHALALSLAPGQAVLRLYQWTPATISLGRNQPALGQYDEAAAARAGLDFVRRPTGGRAVLHDRELTYAVAVHAKALAGPRAAYRTIHEALRDGLVELGIAAELCSPGGVQQRPDTRPCFTDPAPGEIHVEGRKLVGSAQARFGDVLLQHGSILTVNDQSLLKTLVKAAPRLVRASSRDGNGGSDHLEPPGPGLTLAALGVSVPVSTLADAIASGFENRLGVQMTRAAWSETERSRADGLDALYRGPEWTWRR